MSTKWHCELILLTWIGLGLPVAAVSATNEPVLSHARAIELAHAGEFDDSLALIDELRAADPANLQLRYDQIVVLGWANRDDQAIARRPTGPSGRMRIVWAVCDHLRKIVKTFHYTDKSAAEAEAARLMKKKGKEHVVRPHKVPMED